MSKLASKSPLSKAKKLFHSRKFNEVIRILEPEIFKYRESVVFYKTLGIACVYSNDMGGASSYLTRAHELNKDDTDSMLGLAVVSLKRHKPDEAIKLWLDVLEIRPGNKEAARGLSLIRKKLDPEALVDFVESGKMNDLYPQIRPRIGAKILMAVIFLFITAAFLFFGMYLQNTKETNQRPGIEQYVFPSGIKNLVELEGDFRYVLSEEGVRKTFEKAKSHFLAYEDNLATVEINRLLSSNAAPGIKNIAQAMKEHSLKPDFSSIKSSFPLSQVFLDPHLYTGCYVKWRGRAGSVSIKKTRISFFLWVGIERNFEGVVPVYIDFPFDVKNGQELEVLGRIAIEGGKISLHGTALHRIIPGI